MLGVRQQRLIAYLKRKQNQIYGKLRRGRHLSIEGVMCELYRVAVGGRWDKGLFRIGDNFHEFYLPSVVEDYYRLKAVTYDTTFLELAVDMQTNSEKYFKESV